MKSENEDRPRCSDDPIFLHARKEAIIALIVFVLAGVYTITYAYCFGYELEAAAVDTFLGIPSWVVWGIIAPWLSVVLFSFWYSLYFIQDEDLGDDPEDR